MTPANQTQLRLLREAVRAQRELRQSLQDLQDSMSENGLNEQQQETLKEEVVELELNELAIDMEQLQRLRNALYWERP